MNETQRQILADKLNDAKFQVESEKHGVEYLEQRLARAKERLRKAEALVAELSEGVDW